MISLATIKIPKIGFGKPKIIRAAGPVVTPEQAEAQTWTLPRIAIAVVIGILVLVIGYVIVVTTQNAVNTSMPGTLTNLINAGFNFLGIAVFVGAAAAAIAILMSLFRR